MDWSKTKTIFIAVFLILDIFLFTLFLNKFQSYQLERDTNLTITERLEEDKITYSNLPGEPDPLPYLNARVYQFSNSEANNLTGQTAVVRNDLILDSVLDEPIDIEDPANPDELEAYLDEFVLSGSDYTFWDYDEDENRLIYFQEYEDMSLFHNINGRLVVHLNEEDQAISYEQTRLTSIEETAGEQSLIEPETALEEFYGGNVIEPNSEVLEFELGYYPFIQLTDSVSDTQVLTPTWRMLVEQEDGDRENLYINAVNPSIITINYENLEFERLEEIEDTVE